MEGQQLAAELEDISNTSRRSTLRRHYTPGDYLRYASDARYASDTEGYSASSLRRQRRTASTSALARGSPSRSAPPLAVQALQDRG